MTSTHPPRLAKLAEPLGDDEIHVWRVAYRAADGRQPLRAILGAYLGIEADTITLIDSEFGRPSLAPRHDASLQFNWSHSGEHALLALARGITPGVDVERLRPRPRAIEIAQRFFTDAETRALQAAPAIERVALFLELWTAKEAVLKAMGRGLAFGLHRLSIDPSHQALTLRELEDDDPTAWQLQRLPLDAGLVGALAWRGGPRHVRLGILA